MNTAELIQMVRSQIDQKNDIGIDDDQIIMDLNSAQLSLSRKSNRTAPDMLRKVETFSTFTGTNSNEITIPSQTNHFIIKDVFAVVSGRPYPVEYAHRKDVTGLRGAGISGIPLKYCITGNKIELFPIPTSIDHIEIHGQIRLAPLVPVLARVSNYNTTSNKIYLAMQEGLTISNEFTTSVTSLECFINVIDQHLGTIKGTFQINLVTPSETSVTIKTTSLYRDSVFGREVSDALTDDNIGLDDLVCLAQGTCLPTMYRDFTDFLVTHAVVTRLRSLKLDATAETEYLKVLTEEVEDQWNMKPVGTYIRLTKRWNR